MTINRTKQGTAVVNSAIVPAAEMKVLDAIYRSEGSGFAPRLAEATTMADASMYSLLNRLVARGVIHREERIYDVAGTSLKRVMWTLTYATLTAYDEEAQENAQRKS